MANTPTTENDGLAIPDVGRWAQDKYRLVSMYAALFSTGMKNKWDERVYLDLYAGAGFSRIRGTDTILIASPILALSVADSFDKYVFCERDERLLSALKTRTTRIAPKANVSFIPGDCNSQVDRICQEIPTASSTHKVLTLCFVDPFDIEIKFETLRRISTRFVDFLVLLAVYMDANRNYSRYLSEQSHKIDEFLGDSAWRDQWGAAKEAGVPFPNFLAQQFAIRMETVGYLPQPLYNMKKVRSDEKNLPLYFLALFSRHELAYKFWNDVLSYSDDQGKLF
jgi:three-Cys-motif partner protein